MLRIGTQSEKESVEQELKELREQLSQAEQWKQRRDDIVDELNKVWTVRDEDPDETESKALQAPHYPEDAA